MKYKSLLSTSGLIALAVLCGKSASAAPVTLTGFQGFGYNTINGAGQGADGQAGALGCGPTSAAMIFNWYANQQGVAPGLISTPIVDARTMAGSTYMNVDADGFGASDRFQIALEQFALDRGYRIDAQIHVEPTTYNPANWSTYGAAPVAPHVTADATFWSDLVNFQTINTASFLNFVKAEIDAGKPVGVTVDSGGVTGTDHWMVLVGYDLESGQWAGYNTWDTTLHWYGVDSAFRAGNTMGIGFVRTFDFLGPVSTTGGGTGGETGGGNAVPDGGSTAVLFGIGIVGMTYLRRRSS